MAEQLTNDEISFVEIAARKAIRWGAGIITGAAAVHYVDSMYNHFKHNRPLRPENEEQQHEHQEITQA